MRRALCWILLVVAVSRSCSGTNCSLCEDGSPLPDPDKELVFDRNGTLQTCGELEAVADPDVCSSFQGVYGVYCGCDNPISSETACRICGGGTLLPDPSLETMFLGAGNSTEKISCGVSEWAATAYPQILSCDMSQARYGQECCQGTATSAASMQYNMLVPFGLFLIPSFLCLL